MQRVKIALKLMALLLAVYMILRIVFGLVYFNNFSFGDFYWGLRLDFAGLFYINIIFFLFYFFIAPFFSNRISIWLFSLINLPFIALNIIDIVYYRYNLRRSTIDIFYILDDSIHSFGALFKQYWYILLIFILFAIGFVWMVKKIIRHKERIKIIGPVIFIGISFLLARGWDSRPIVPSTPLLYIDASRQPLVNNSTLNLLYSWLRFSTPLERKNYFTESALDSIYTIRREYPQEQGMDKRNVVVFILESFNENFFIPGPDRAKTPFFDSLRAKSIVCTNAYANGHESSKGIMAILGSMPPFLDEPIFISNYNAVPFKGIGTLLKEEGYNTNFFLGAEYDHFNFAKLCRMTGIDNYYSKDTYHHSEHDDGNWGIYDEYFFNYFADETAKKKQPFLSVLFNISSHPPFAVPSNRKSVSGQTPQQNSITYVDDCFRALFNKIRTQPWFNNTLFVFCADHTLVQNLFDKSYQFKGYHIPLFIYDPQSQPMVISNVVQQLDIVPSILDRLHYNKPFMSFGNSFFQPDSSKRFSVYKTGDVYQLTDSSTLTGFDARSEKLLYQYQYKTDTLLQRNQILSPGKQLLLKAIIQRFNNSLIEGKLLPKIVSPPVDTAGLK